MDGAAPSTTTRTAGTIDPGETPEQTARRAYDLLAEGFGPGSNGPLIVTVQGDAAADPARLDAFVQTLSTTEGVAAAFTNPAGGVLGWEQLWPRLAVATAYLFVLLLQVAGLAFWLGTRTDAPLAAVGGAVLVVIVSSILGQIEALGEWRNAFPMHYNRAWLELLNASVDWTPIRRGVLWSLGYAVLFVALAYRSFRRKDILS